MAGVQQGFVKIQKLLQVEPFKIVGLWTNGETRLNDFYDDVEKWKNGSNKELKKLANPKIVKTAFVKDGTLAFAGSTVQVPGIPGPQPVDFDRRVLYSDSQLIGNAVSYEDAIAHQIILNRKRRTSALAHLEAKPMPDTEVDMQAKTINKIAQKIGTPVTPLIVIGDELVELETTWIFSDL